MEAWRNKEKKKSNDKESKQKERNMERKERKNFLSERKDYFFKEKHFSKEDSKALENVLRTWRDVVNKAGKDISKKQIREKRR